jgi:cytidylate kinase
MAVVTISRQMGSLGCEVAHRAGQLLGYKIVWRELINQAAIRAGAPEVALAAIDELGLLGITPSKNAIQAYLNAINEVMQELVYEGNVIIVGRAGQIILKDVQPALHVRIVAPISLRVARIASAHRVSEDAARAQMTASDRYRRSYLKRFYHVEWDSPELYDLVINTAHFSPEKAAELIQNSLLIKYGIQASRDLP